MYILARTSTAHRWRSSRKTLGNSTRKNKSNNLEPHFPTSATNSQSLDDEKTVVALPHCSESTRDSIAGWWTFFIRGDVGVMAEIRNVVRKQNGGRGASSREFVRKIGFSDCFVGDAIQASWAFSTPSVYWPAPPPTKRR